MDANRLRDAAAVLEVDSAYRRDAAIMREAADEVDRLRHDIERHVEIACELATECERLRAELAACKRLLTNAGLIAAQEEHTALRAEVEELRGWLVAIADEIDDNGPIDGPGHCHSSPFKWDDGNHPDIAGQPCEWCLMWVEIRVALQAARKGEGE